MKIKDASQLLNINYQTSKSIMRLYRQTGKMDRSNRILKTKSELNGEI
jgi:hypothetical protein